MFTRSDPTDALLLENINAALLALKSAEPETERYEQIRKQLTELHKIRNDNRSARVSPDTVASICAHLLGIGIIVKHEQFNVITSKAMSFVRKIF